MFVRDDSDWDVWLIVTRRRLRRLRGALRHRARRSVLEIGTDTVAGLRAHGEPGTSHCVEPIRVSPCAGARRQARRRDRRDRREQANAARGSRARDRRRGTRRLRQQHLSVAQGPPPRSRWSERTLDAADAASHLLEALFAHAAAACGRGRSTSAGSSSRSRSQRAPSGAQTCSSTASRAFSGTVADGPAAALPRRRGARPQRRTWRGVRQLGAVARAAARDETERERSS